MQAGGDPLGFSDQVLVFSQQEAEQLARRILSERFAQILESLQRVLGFQQPKPVVAAPPVAVPEPASIALFGAGLLGLLFAGRHSRDGPAGS